MINQANQYKNPADRAKYLDAAARFRLPYWDPIMPRKQRDPTGPLSTVWGLPLILSLENIYVRTQSAPDRLIPMRNPLYSFKFPTLDEWDQPRQTERIRLDQPTEYSQVETTRVPDTQGNTNNKALDLSIQRQSGNLATKIWHMLNPDESSVNSQGVKVMVNEERSWNSFANMNVPDAIIGGESFATVSVESWHNGVHNLIGTGNIGGAANNEFTGQMADPAYAAFEPMFWLHHGNIDRLLSLYQSLYGKNVDTAEALNQLYPFKKNMDRKCFDSSDEIVKNYWAPGFAIPGSKPIDHAKDLVKQYLTDTYYWATSDADVPEILPNWPKNLAGSEALYGDNAKPVDTAAIEMRALSLSSGAPRLVARTQSLPIANAVSPRTQEKHIQVKDSLEIAHTVDRSLPKMVLSMPKLASKPLMQTWNANIKVRKFAFNGSFNIHVFIGFVKDNQPERYITKKNEVGFTGVFASSKESQCASCKTARDQDVICEDVVPLTTQLTDYLASNPRSQDLIAVGNIRTLQSLEPEHVVPFLREHLQWRITDTKSRLLVGQEQQAGLKVIITNRTFQPPNEEHLLGVYGSSTAYPAITQDKAGGYGHVYD